jgi:hypothetical protein
MEGTILKEKLTNDIMYNNLGGLVRGGLPYAKNRYVVYPYDFPLATNAHVNSTD